MLDGKYVLREWGARTRRYHYGEGRGVAVNDSGGSRWLLEDGLGSTSAEVSANAATVTARQYDAWGNYRNSTAPTGAEARLGFTGHQFDIEFGLTYARARYYDSSNGVFLSRDPNEGTLSDAPSLHRYAYAHSNPLRYVDIDGRCPSSAAGRYGMARRGRRHARLWPGAGRSGDEAPTRFARRGAAALRTSAQAYSPRWSGAGDPDQSRVDFLPGPASAFRFSSTARVCSSSVAIRRW